MAQHRQSVLPHAVGDGLRVLAGASGGEQATLAQILADLSRLPAASIVRASEELARSARYGPWPQPSLLDQFVLPSWQQARIKRSPDYAWLFLFDPNGRIREAALDSIERPPNTAFLLAALFWRANDWAKPVRLAAERCLQRVAQQITPDVVASAAPYLLDRRHEWGRWSNEANLLDRIFGRQDVLAMLAESIRRGTNGPFGKHLRLALRYDAIDEHLSMLAASAIQPQVRAIACQSLLTGRASWSAGFEWQWIDKIYGIRKRVPKFEGRLLQAVAPSPDLFWQAARDKSVIVRRAAADALIAARAPVPDAEQLIAHLVQDKDPSVRWRADYLRRHPPGT